MIVVCLEGSHGAGKTELCKMFADDGFHVLDEGFLDMPEYALHPQSLLMETTWVCSWFTRLLRQASELRQRAAERGDEAAEDREAIFIADRSPFSAVLYSKRHGYLLEPVIREHIRELAKEAGILVVTVHVQVEKELLWSRIQARLRQEPQRAKYGEDRREWMEHVLSFYDEFAWDVTVSNNGSLEDLAHRTKVAIADNYDRFRTAVADQLTAPSPVARSRGDSGPSESRSSPVHSREGSPMSLATPASTLVDDADTRRPKPRVAKRRRDTEEWFAEDSVAASLEHRFLD